MQIKTFTKGLHHFFFHPLPPHSIALLRIAYGLLLIFNWFTVFPYRHYFYTSEGIVSYETAVTSTSFFHLDLFHWLPRNDTGMMIVMILNLVAAVGVLLGFMTRTSTALAFLTLLSIQFRNIYILNSADTLFRNLLFLMIFSAAGKVYSLDSWIFKKEKEELYAPWALRLIQIQFCMVYISTVLFKMKGAAWADGTAIYIATRLEEFLRLPLPWVLDNMALLKFMTWGTLATEFALGTLIWFKELRYWVLGAGLMLHLGIDWVMNIPMFEYLMIFTMIAMVYPEHVRLKRYFVLAS